VPALLGAVIFFGSYGHRRRRAREWCRGRHRIRPPAPRPRGRPAI